MSILMDNFKRGAEESGHEVNVIDVCRADVNPCIGCVKCGYEGPCVAGRHLKSALLTVAWNAEDWAFEALTAHYKTLVQAHYINKGIRENGKLSVNIVDESWLNDADRMGTISGNKADKSEAFVWTMGENGAPLIHEAKVSIECEVDGNYELEHFDHFICKILATYADEGMLNEAGKIDYHIFKPVLFEFPTYEYFVTGDKVGNCGKMN